MPTATGQIRFLAPDWFEVSVSESARVLVRAPLREGRRVITRVVIDGTDLDARDLKAISVARLESRLNHPKYGPIGGGAGRPPTAEELADLETRGVLFPSAFAAVDAGLDAYLGARPPKPVRAKAPPPRARLTRPDGSDPQAFYALVARAYLDAAESTRAPAPILAEEAGVPVPTVHRWITEARRRKLLAPARRNAAG